MLLPLRYSVILYPLIVLGVVFVPVICYLLFAIVAIIGIPIGGTLYGTDLLVTNMFNRNCLVGLVPSVLLALIGSALGLLLTAIAATLLLIGFYVVALGMIIIGLLRFGI